MHKVNVLHACLVFHSIREINSICNYVIFFTIFDSFFHTLLFDDRDSSLWYLFLTYSLWLLENYRCSFAKATWKYISHVM